MVAPTVGINPLDPMWIATSGRLGTLRAAGGAARAAACSRL